MASLLGACAHLPEFEPRLRETDDLGAVAQDALEAAARLGPEQVLVVLDLDNTLLAMEQGLGSDAWYEWQKHLAETNPCHPAYVGDRFAVQGALYFASAMRPTQPDAAAQVRRLRAAGLPVMVLTARGVDYRLQTFRELRRHGFAFAASDLAAAPGPGEVFVPPSGERPALFEDGVYLTAGQHKGAMLRDLLDRTGAATPALIVMADDKRANLEAMLETFGAEGVPVHAWRYAREDPVVEAFDADAAHALWSLIQPALATLQGALGADNYRLPEAVTPPGCD